MVSCCVCTRTSQAGGSLNQVTVMYLTSVQKHECYQKDSERVSLAERSVGFSHSHTNSLCVCDWQV